MRKLLPVKDIKINNGIRTTCLRAKIGASNLWSVLKVFAYFDLIAIIETVAATSTTKPTIAVTTKSIESIFLFDSPIQFQLRQET